MDQSRAVPSVDGDNELEAAAQRFERWRQGRRRGEHIPRELWVHAVGLSARYGTHRVAVALGLNADRLLRRVHDVDTAVAEAPPPEPVVAVSAPQFVEMVVASPEGEAAAQPMLASMPVAMSAPAPTCVLELRNARGATLRVELPAPQVLPILPGLCAAFSGA